MDTINKIILLMEERKCTQKELTDFLGVEKSTFSAWKSGKSQSYSKYISKIADYLEVSTDYLLSNNDTSDISKLNHVYLSLAKQAQDEGIDPDDIELAIKTIKAMRNK